MILYSKPFKMRLKEHPFFLDKTNGTKVLTGRFNIKKKYQVFSVYGTDQFTDFLTADEEGVFHWVSSELCRKK